LHHLIHNSTTYLDLLVCLVLFVSIWVHILCTSLYTLNAKLNTENNNNNSNNNNNMKTDKVHPCRKLKDHNY